ncbi:MAG: adenylate/guanylate cyclase domain-containing protein [Actinobacteria bacterium]|nr:adenylate/guanylate cyclase domain-containing protein [Actinomycetota bacterium]
MPQLPTGIVTFLFTDIEGSTRLMQELGRDAYARVQDEQAAIMRGAIAQGNGTEIRTEGDSFFVVFATPADGVQACVAAQRELEANAWPQDGAIRVRMGLHTGEGMHGGDDYLGIEVNRAARIAALGHGGQILLSEATVALVANALPDGVALRDLGRHRLKDFDHRERLHEVAIDGLPTEFPALRSADARRTNLPAQRTSFVGREREVAEIGELLAGARLLTITGPGGTGKTRLALEVAAAQTERFPDGVFLVDLGAVTEPALVTPAIAGVLGVREQPGERLDETVFHHVGELQLLLVLDNLEQLLEAGPAVSGLLEHGPAVRVLATSRIPLRLTGEHEYRLDPLPLPDAEAHADPDALAACESVRMFVERARRSNRRSASRATTPPPSPRSSPGWTACRLRSSSRPASSAY